MRNPKTVFIVGAGASNELGLPIGKDLIESVAQKLAFEVRHGSLFTGPGDEEVLEALQIYARPAKDMNSYLSACRRVREGVIYSNSIDSFIDVHSEDEKIQRCGKLAIAKTIIDAERKSHLYLDRPDAEFANVKKLKESWIFNFARHANDGIRKSEIHRIFEKVAFIVFNYDRCIEHFFYHALQDHYGIDAHAASSVMETLKIIHPYGTIGKLPWQERGGIAFGANVTGKGLQLMTSRIRTYTEEIGKAEALLNIRDEIKSAGTLVYLGFSYHPQNMKLLDPGGECEIRQVFGTAHGISQADADVIKSQIRKMVRNDLTYRELRGNARIESERLDIRNDLTCAHLLSEYSRSLFIAGHIS